MGSSLIFPRLSIPSPFRLLHDLRERGCSGWIQSVSTKRTMTRKLSQVEAMRYICCRAKQTPIWLGKESYNSTIGFNFAEKLNEVRIRENSLEKALRNKFRDYYEFSAVFGTGWKAFFDLFDRPLFARACTLQEVALLSKALVIFGESFILSLHW